uniref:dCMP deaminase n=1 Tax=Astyanax mexicanus TaxID=7994 RepID=A0A8B9H0Z7_ASTMX
MKLSFYAITTYWGILMYIDFFASIYAHVQYFCSYSMYLLIFLNCTVINLLLMVCVAAVCHAELNAIMNKNSADVKGCSMYVALFPCNECAKLIIQAGGNYYGFIGVRFTDFNNQCSTQINPIHLIIAPPCGIIKQ